MTLDELIADYRADALDLADPPFCSDELLAQYASEGQTEAARRGHLIRDAVSPLTSISYLSDAEYVRLDPRIINIVRARIDNQEACEVSMQTMDCILPNWQGDTTRDRPTRLVSGLSAGLLYLWPRPRDAGTIKLVIDRLPLVMLTKCGAKPEIRTETHPALVQYMLYKAYSRTDSDQFDEKKAAIAMSNFTLEFGHKVSGRNEEWMRQGNGDVAEPIA